MKTPLPLSLIALLGAAPLQAQLALIRQGPETRGEQEDGDRFGAAVCAGDFNGDGYDDLAAGAPGEKLGFNFFFAGGYVTVNYGTPYGLTWSGSAGRGPAQAGLDEGEPHEMGAALASADFNADGYDDLAVGMPGSPAGGNSGAGRVAVFMGSANGLSSSAALVLTQTAFGGANESRDRFGAALAAGRLGTDQYADLVIGAPGENGTGSGDIGEGAVFIIRGGVDGLDPGLTKFITGETALPGAASQNGGYGASLALGHLRDDAAAELAVGAPWLMAAGRQGAVLIHAANATSVGNAAAHGLAAGQDTILHSSTAGFGYALAIGRFNPQSAASDPNARRALAIGTFNSGSVSLVRINGATPEFYGHLSPPSAATAADGTGRSLATGDLDGDGDDDLAIGQPLHNAATTSLNGFWPAGSGSGRVALRYYNGSTWSAQNEYWDEADAGALYANGAMGRSLATGRFSSGARHSVAAGCPGADIESDGAGYVLDLAPWRQVRRPGCRAAISVDCENYIVYALRPFDRLKIASTTKIMTVLLGCEATARPAHDPLRVNAGDKYTIESWLADQFTASTSCSKWVFNSGDRYRFDDLMRTCICVSGNDSAYAIADAMTGEASSWDDFDTTVPQFTALMNARAAQIGMNDTLFTNPAGVDTGDPYSTAWDMWLLARTAMQNELFREITTPTVQTITYNLSGGGTATRSGNYGWLSGLKNQDARIVGIKPGGTPLAGRTCVIAGSPANQPEKLAYGVGLGWFGEYQDESQRARVEIVQLGIKACDPTLVVSLTHALSDAAAGLLKVDEPWSIQGLLEPRGAGQRAEPVDIHLIRPADLDATPPVEVKFVQDLRCDLPAGGTTELVMTGLVSHRGFLVRNTGATAAPLIITAAPGTARVTLSPYQAHLIPAAAGPLSIRLTADGARADLTLSGICDITPRWPNITFAPAATVRLEPPAHVVQHAWRIIACPLSDLPQPFPLRIIVEEPFNGLRFPRVPDLDALVLTPGGGSDRLTLDFHGVPGLEPGNGYDVLGGGALDGSWQTLTRITPAADGRAVYHRTLSVPAAARRFLKIVPVP